MLAVYFLPPHSTTFFLLFQYVFVSTKTNALHNACEHLLADQTALINAADSLRENLEYFIEHDRISTVNDLFTHRKILLKNLSKYFFVETFLDQPPSYW